MLTRYFEQEGYRVSAAKDGAAMRAHLRSRPVDVILLDVVLPGQDGLTIAREIRGKDVVLTSGEFDLLAALAKHPGRVFSRETLMEHTRGHGTKAFDRTIDAQIVRLRKKIERDPKNPMIVKSVRAVGYVFTARVDR
jgi:DNA-binding response OmpR family regulator